MEKKQMSRFKIILRQRCNAEYKNIIVHINMRKYNPTKVSNHLSETVIIQQPTLALLKNKKEA